MRPYALTAVRGGIDRQRNKGGAERDSLYLLKNGYVTPAHTVKPRPGTLRDATLPDGTVGLVAFKEKLHVFASSSVDLSSFPLYRLNILLHPEPASTTPPTLSEIHFAEPFLGALYVVAEFEDGGVYHYWLQEPDEWTKDTEYSANELVVPTTANGYAYRALRFGDAYPAWAPGVARTAGNGSSVDPDRVEPTVYNEYYFEVVDTEGDNPRSGSLEPDWPTSTGQQVVENTDGFDAGNVNAPAPPSPPAANTPQAATLDRYQRGSER